MKNLDKIIIAPSILSADFSELGVDIKKVEKAGADWIHVDVMDGHFVPNITIGAPVVKSIRKVTEIPLDVHLMIENPERYIDDFAVSGSDIITVHYEACKDSIIDVIDQIKQKGIKSGVSIKPKTPVEVLTPIINKLDLVLIMTVEPGFGGQKFIAECLQKIKDVRNLINDSGKYIDLEVDGGINEETAKLAVEAGANALVAGSYIYKSTDIPLAIKTLKQNTL